MENSLENFNQFDAQKRINDIRIDGMSSEIKISDISCHNVVQQESFGQKMTETEYDFLVAHYTLELVSLIRKHGIGSVLLESIKALYLAYYDKCSRNRRGFFLVQMSKWINPKELVALEPIPRGWIEFIEDN